MFNTQTSKGLRLIAEKVNFVFLKRIIFVLFALWFSVNAKAENQVVDRFFAEFRALVTEKYVNPNEINLESWLNSIEQLLRANCKDVPCYNSDFERILNSEVRKVNDYHFSVLSLQPDENDIPEITLGQKTRLFTFGFQALLSDNRLVVRYVHPKTPADRVGLRVGDEILSMNDTQMPASELLQSIDRQEARHLTTKLKIGRGGSVEITMQLTPESSKFWEPWYQMLNADTALLFIPSLSVEDITELQIHKLVKEISRLGITKLIVDLRVTRGGIPYTVINSVGAFLPAVKRIYKTKPGLTITYEFKNSAYSYQTSAKPDEIITGTIDNLTAQFKGSVRLLTSADTVSGPENFAEILQTAKRARIVGEPTLGGAGVSAEVFNLSSGGRLGLSTYRQYHSDGSIVPTKVIPDLKINLDINRLSKGEDTQIQAALQDFNATP
jgi:C-terminal processing protease CtpA/Prc